MVDYFFYRRVNPSLGSQLPARTASRPVCRVFLIYGLGIKMPKINTIDTRTGNFVKYDYESKTEKVKVGVDKILCYGCWSENGVEIVTKDQIPNWESIQKPKLVFYDHTLDDSPIVINPDVGLSFIMQCGQIIPNPGWRVIYVQVQCGCEYWLFTKDRIIMISNGYVDHVLEHSIPDLENSIVMDERPAEHLLVYKNGIVTNYDFSGELETSEECQAWFCDCSAYSDDCSCDWVIRPTPTKVPAEIKTIRTEYKLYVIGHLVIARSPDDQCYLMDTRNGSVHWCEYSDALMKLAHKSPDFALNQAVAKFYQNDKIVIILPDFIKCEDDHMNPGRSSH